MKASDRDRGTRVGLLLLLLATIPWAGAVGFAIDRFDDARRSQALADRSVELAQDFAAMAELRSTVLDERNLRAASMGVAELGIGVSLVEDLTGIDLEAELTETQRRVDELVDAVDLDLATPLATIRSDDVASVDDLSARYIEIEAVVDTARAQVFTDLFAVTGDLDGAGRLIKCVRVLDSAALARRSLTSQLAGFFESSVSGADDAPGHIVALSVDRTEQIAAWDAVGALTGPPSQARRAFESIQENPDVATFAQAVDDLVESSLRTATDPEIRSAAPTGDIGPLAGLFESGAESVAAHQELARAATADVADAGEALSLAAETRSDRSLLLAVFFSIASIIGVGLLARSIRRPLHRLAEAATRLRDGESDVAVEATGPHEVREVASAIREASLNLQLAERQAHALARGDIDDPILAERTAGSLGSSLHAAVQNLAGSMSETAEFRRRLAHESTHDGLTGLLNRNATLAHLHDGLARMRRTDNDLAVLFVDLDNFRHFNDVHGHPTGDRILQTVARRIRLALRDGDQVGRLGGDEFLVVAEPISDPAEATALARQLTDAVAAPVDVGSGIVHPSVSVGIAIPSSPDQSPDELLHDADLAIDAAKTSGGSSIAVCDADLRSRAASQVSLEHALRDAIVAGELEMHYQPIVDRDGVRSGVEALVRWRRPGRGLVPPDDFIPVAERSELIVELDHWVLDRVAHDVAASHFGGPLHDCGVAVNVSGRSLGTASFVDDVFAATGRHGVDPRVLIVEVSENAILDDLSGAAERLGQLRARGVRVAIDDFGTGYTSLSHLRELPFDILKIDRSFIADESATSLVQFIIDTGHLLGASIIAEGVETPEQADLLVRMGSDELQGYLYGRPTPLDELTHVEETTDRHDDQVGAAAH